VAADAPAAEGIAVLAVEEDRGDVEGVPEIPDASVGLGRGLTPFSGEEGSDLDHGRRVDPPLVEEAVDQPGGGVSYVLVEGGCPGSRRS
jgi:hypothetical protein